MDSHESCNNKRRVLFEFSPTNFSYYGKTTPHFPLEKFKSGFTENFKEKGCDFAYFSWGVTRFSIGKSEKDGN